MSSVICIDTIEFTCNVHGISRCQTVAKRVALYDINSGTAKGNW